MTASWDAALYAANTDHHRRHDDDFLGGLTLPAGARVLDVGCGVGDFTARLATLGPGVEVLGVDADPGMIAAAARRATPSVRFAVCRAQELDRVVPADSTDAVFSVAALHWVPATDHAGVLGQIRRVLRAGGLFRAQFGGQGQIAPVKAILDEESARLGGGPAGWFFPSPADYRPLLSAAGFAVADGGWVRLLRQVRRFGTAEQCSAGCARRPFRRTSRCCPGGRGGVPPPGPRSGRWPSCDAPTVVRSRLRPP